ncbi:hypothetical protein [Helcococcus kunzii]|nr:hypothetical protein [Helcococcus kunzii]
MDLMKKFGKLFLSVISYIVVTLIIGVIMFMIKGIIYAITSR